MWLLFKIINFVWLLTSTSAWFTTSLPFAPMLVIVNLSMMFCMSYLHIRIRLDGQTGLVLLCILLISIWNTIIDNVSMGGVMFMSYFPVLMLMMLPYNMLKDLLSSVTKWYTIIVGLGLVEYFILFVVNLPSFGLYVHPAYKPYTNYLFFIKTTFDYGIFDRYNAIFLEPGHQAMLSTFLIIANKFNFRTNRWCIVLLVCVLFSFSLAGYLLLFTGWTLYWINNSRRALLILGLAVLGVIMFKSWNGGDNPINELIIERLEYDEEKGIKGNNRFTTDTDFIYSKGQKNGWNWVGMKDHANMDLVKGAGFKIFVTHNGWIAVILVLMFYISVIPLRSDYRYDAIFLTVIMLCFIQRSYPYTYTWLFPYVTGIYLAKGDKEEMANQESEE